MRIVHLVGDMRLTRDPEQEGMSGVVSATLSLAAAQVRRGHEVLVASVGESAWRRRWRGVSLAQLPSTSWLHLRLGGRSLDLRTHGPYLGLLARRRFDVVHGSPYYYLRLLPARLRLAYFHTDPLHQSGGEERATFSEADFRLVARTTAAQVAVSQFIAGQLERGLNGRGCVYVVYNGVDAERFGGPDALAERPRRRAELCLPTDAPVFLYAGAVVPEKGVLHLARAFMALADEMPQARLVIAGGSALWMQNLWMEDPSAAYEQAVRDVLAPAVARGQAQLLGKVGAATMPGLYAASDVVVIPSVWNDPFPLVALEALASGRPVIASAVGGLPESIGSHNGVLVPPGDEAALVAAMRSLTVPSRREPLASAAQASALRFSWDGAAAEIDQVYARHFDARVAPLPQVGSGWRR